MIIGDSGHAFPLHKVRCEKSLRFRVRTHYGNQKVMGCCEEMTEKKVWAYRS
jgi:hypothetical protein